MSRIGRLHLLRSMNTRMLINKDMHAVYERLPWSALLAMQQSGPDMH